MTWSVHLNECRNYLEVVITGKTSWQDLQAITAECVSRQKTQGVTMFLIDASAMETTARIAEVYQLPASEYQKQNVNRRTRIAVLYSPSGPAEDIIKFYETACTNRNWGAKSFANRDEAIAWLAGTVPSSTTG